MGQLRIEILNAKLPPTSTSLLSADGMQISLFIRLVLAVIAGLLAWATGPFGILDKGVVSEIPAWILPGIVFGTLVLIHLWTSPSRAVIALGIGVFAWVAAFATAAFGWLIVGWLSPVVAGLISGAILGFLVPRLTQSFQYFRHFMALSIAGFLGSIPFALCFIMLDFKRAPFPPQWVIPSYIFWNILIATALHLCAKSQVGRVS